jgi:hypothetical protein
MKAEECDLGQAEPKTGLMKQPYEPPRILSREPLEAAAGLCGKAVLTGSDACGTQQPLVS